MASDIKSQVYSRQLFWKHQKQNLHYRLVNIEQERHNTYMADIEILKTVSIYHAFSQTPKGIYVYTCVYIVFILASGPPAVGTD